MKFRSAICTIFVLLQHNIANGQALEKAWASGEFSYFTAGFAILFIAVFVFSFSFKTIVNSRKQDKTQKQIVRSSLLLALVTAVILILVIYLFLVSFQ